MESDGNGFGIEEKARLFASASRTLRKKLPVTHMGSTAQVFRVDRLPAEGMFKTVQSEFKPLEELSVEFRLSEVDFEALKEGKDVDLSVVAAAAEDLAMAEDRFISIQLQEQAGLKVKLDDWEKPGDGLKNLMKTISEISSKGLAGPYTCLVSPELYSKLLGVVDGSRLEISILKEVMDIVVTPAVNAAIVLATPPPKLGCCVGS